MKRILIAPIFRLSLSSRVMAGGPKIRRFFANPAQELFYLWMQRQRFERIELAFESLLEEQSVNVVMARPA